MGRTKKKISFDEIVHNGVLSRYRIWKMRVRDGMKWKDIASVCGVCVHNVVMKYNRFNGDFDRFDSVGTVRFRLRNLRGEW